MRNDEPTPFEYFKLCITERYADFDFRARRAEYWYFSLFSFLINIPLFILMIIGMALESEVLAIISGAIMVLIALALILPGLAVTVRRLHDTNKSGWFYLIAFIPFGSIILFVFTVTEGDRHPNMYGPDPKAQLPSDLTDHLERR